MTRMYFDVPQVRNFLLENGFVATLRDPRVTRGANVERVDLWTHDGRSRWGKPLGLSASRVYCYSAMSDEEIEPLVAISSFRSAKEWWTKATSLHRPKKVVRVDGKKVPLWDLALYYVQLLAPILGRCFRCGGSLREQKFYDEGRPRPPMKGWTPRPNKDLVCDSCGIRFVELGLKGAMTKPW